MNLSTAKVTALLLVLCMSAACGNNNSDKKNEKTDSDTAKPAPVTTEPVAMQTDVIKPAIINIIDTIAGKQIIVCFKDSAATMERISLKLAKIYGVTLAEVFKKNNSKPAGAPMAWYNSVKAPYFFEAGIPVNKIPAKLPKGVFVKELNTDSAVVAHFYGPYSLLSQGYDAVKEWMKDAKKKSTAAPYEVYIGDPVDTAGNLIDPYKVRTDIIFPRK